MASFSGQRVYFLMKTVISTYITLNLFKALYTIVMGKILPLFYGQVNWGRDVT